LKFGDRFYYENGQDANLRFTSYQLDEIRKASLSRIFCDNVKMKKVRRNVFLTTSKWIRCKNVEKVSLRAWKDYSVGIAEEYQSEKYSKAKY